MLQPKKWWIGLLPLGLVWGVANWVETPKVEADILSRAKQALAVAAKDMTRSEITVSGRDITLSGEAVKSDVPQNASGAAEQLRGTRLVHAAVSTAQVQRPYTLGAERDGNAVTLSGFAPAADVKDKLAAAARSAFGGSIINDQLKLGAGAPPQFDAVASHGFQQLAGLSKGKFSLSDQSYSLEGIARDSATFAALAGLASALPGGFKPGTIAVTAPPVSPYTFEARREGDTVTLTGYAPDQAAREKLLTAARAAYPGLKIDDKLAFGSGAPQGFAAITAHGLELAGKLSPGSFSLAGNNYSLSGAAPDAAVYEATLAALKSLPGRAAAGKTDILAPEVKPYAWSIRRGDDGRIAIGGVVPDSAVRDAILAQAARLYPGAAVVSTMQIARTAPAGFAAASGLAVEQFGKLQGGAISLTDGGMSVAGVAGDQANADAVAKALAALPAGFRVANNAVQVAIPEVKPYGWSIRRNADGSISIEGAVPDAATRDALLAQAARLYPGARIVSTMQIARTAPAGFAAAASLALEQFGKLKGGAFSLSDGALSLSGEASDQAGADALMKAFAGLPGGFKFANTAIPVAIPEVKPYGWSIRRNADGSLSIVGAVPDAATRDALLAQVARLYPGVKIENNMQIAKTAPAGFAAAAAAGIEAMGKLKGGVFSLSDGALSVSGQALDQASADALSRLLGGLGSAFKLASNAIAPPAPVRIEIPVAAAPAVSVPEVKAKPVEAPAPPVAAMPAPAPPVAVSCVPSGDKPIATGTIYFDEGSHVLAAGQEAALRELLARFKTCGDARVELVGHTNSNGDRARNIQLSTLRTFAASRWLQKNGISQKRIQTLGFGEDRPALSDNSPDAAAKNRRVEISVR